MHDYPLLARARSKVLHAALCVFSGSSSVKEINGIISFDSFCRILTDLVLALHRQQQRQLLWLGAYKHIGAVRFALWIQLAILLLRQAAVHVYATQQAAGRVMRGELYIIICKDRRIRI